MLHIPSTNLLLLAAKQEPYKKAYLLTKNIEEFSGKSSGEWTGRQKTKQLKMERVTGPGRRTREEIVKWNQMTGGDIRPPQPPFGSGVIERDVSHYPMWSQSHA